MNFGLNIIAMKHIERKDYMNILIGLRDKNLIKRTAKEQSTFEREIRPFELIRDFNRRILLTTDVEPVTTYKGIQKINVIDWLTTV